MQSTIQQQKLEKLFYHLSIQITTMKQGNLTSNSRSKKKFEEMQYFVSSTQLYHSSTCKNSSINLYKHN